MQRELSKKQKTFSLSNFCASPAYVRIPAPCPVSAIRWHSEGLFIKITLIYSALLKNFSNSINVTHMLRLLIPALYIFPVVLLWLMKFAAPPTRHVHLVLDKDHTGRKRGNKLHPYTQEGRIL